MSIKTGDRMYPVSSEILTCNICGKSTGVPIEGCRAKIHKEYEGWCIFVSINDISDTIHGPVNLFKPEAFVVCPECTKKYLIKRKTESCDQV